MSFCPFDEDARIPHEESRSYTTIRIVIFHLVKSTAATAADYA